MPRRHSNQVSSQGYQGNHVPAQGRRYEALRALGVCGPCRYRLSAAGFTGTAGERMVCHDCERLGLGGRAFELSVPFDPELRQSTRRVQRNPVTGEIYNREGASRYGDT